MLRVSPLEYSRSFGDQFDEFAAELHVSAVGMLVFGQVAAQLAPLFLELVPTLTEEVLGDEPVKAIVIEPIHEHLLLLDLGADLLDDRLVVDPLLLAALRDALQQPRLRLVWDGDAREEDADLFVELLLANVGLAACLLAGAVVVDVPRLLDLCREVSAAGAADQQTFVCEVVFAIDRLLVGAEGRLDRIPELTRDQRRMVSRPNAALPPKSAIVERVLEQPLKLAEADELALFGRRETLVAQFLSQRLQRVGASCVELVGAAHHRCLDGIRDDDLAVAFADIAVAEGRLVRKAAFLNFLRHAFLDFIGQVVDVVLGQQHHHAEGQLAGRIVRKVLLPEQRLRRQLVNSQVITEVTAETIDLLADDSADRRVLPSGLNHSRERTTSRLLGGLDIDELFDDGIAVALGILADSL